MNVPRQSHLARICGAFGIVLAACTPPTPPSRVPVTPVASAPPRDRDADCDGVADVDDACPAAAEDRDGFQDEDGCPDPDNDQDRIPDECDQCPDEPETYNGVVDEDGCPDKALVRISRSSIQILNGVFFVRGSAQIRPESLPLIDEVALVLKDHPELDRIAMLGHASSDEASPLRLSERRAGAVSAAVVARGIDVSRVESHGYGSSRPAVRGARPADLERNRRVEFSILRIQGHDPRAWDGDHLVDIAQPELPPIPRQVPRRPIEPCVLRVAPPLPSAPCRAAPRQGSAPGARIPRN